jgi:hypothetical protein
MRRNAASGLFTRASILRKREIQPWKKFALKITNGGKFYQESKRRNSIHLYLENPRRPQGMSGHPGSSALVIK